MFSALLAISCAILFAVNMDGAQRSFSVTRGISFYLQVCFFSTCHKDIGSNTDHVTSPRFCFQIVVIVLTVVLLIMAVYDVLFACRPGGDPTEPAEISSAPATTYNNPGFREGSRTNGECC